MALAQSVIFALEAGSYLAVATVGFTLIYGVVNMINFAYGEYMTIGAYTAFVSMQLFDVGVLLTIPIVLVVSTVAGYAISRATFVPMRGAGAVPLLLASIGLGMLLRNGYRLVGGAQIRFIDFPSQVYRTEALGGFFINTRHGLVIGSAFVVFVLIHVLMTRTNAGIAMRATSHSELLARASGINTDRVRRNVWLMSSGLAGFSGFLLGLTSSIAPLMGFDEVLLVIAAAILGGVGSVYGAVIGAYVIGFVMIFASSYLPGAISNLGTVFAFLLLIIMLLVRPTGIADVAEGDV
ncbi:MAG: branched-chain amino acid ABC transporter permease [Halobacteriota archaeon]